MTNREWLHTLSNQELANQQVDSCNMCVLRPEDCAKSGMSCREGILIWLDKEHKND